MTHRLKPQEEKLARQFFERLKKDFPDITLVGFGKTDEALVVQLVMPTDEAREVALREKAWERSGDVLMEYDQVIQVESALFALVVELPVESAPADAVRMLWPLYLELGPFIRQQDGGRAKGLAPGRSGRVEVACRVRSLDFATGALLGWLRERGFEDVRVWKEEPGGARMPLYPLAFAR